MNALIPALVAILLAEIGGPLARLGLEQRRLGALAIVTVAAAGIAGGGLAHLFLLPPRTLLLGLALLFAGAAQLQRVAARTVSRFSGLMILWRAPSPFVAFALAGQMNAPVSASIGAVVGLAAAMGATAFLPRLTRAIAGVLLCLAGIFATLTGLRIF